MMVGHAMLAFAIAGTVAHRMGRGRRTALTIGVVAALFATLPDVDMLYALFGAFQWALSATPASVGTGVWRATGAFWSSSTVVHRAVTHSLVVAVPAALAFTWASGDRQRRLAALCLFAGLGGVAFLASGPLGASVMLAFLLGGVAIAQAVAGRTDLPARTLFVAALFGLASHPFGDLFTGTPPHLFYPFDLALFPGRVALVPDPTLNLVAVFLLELATIWAALTVYARLSGHAVRPHVHPRATLGAGYAIAAVTLPAPTLDVSYHFVFSVLAVGLIGVTPRERPVVRWPTLDTETALAAAFTAVAAITLAAGAYTAVYLFY